MDLLDFPGLQRVLDGYPEAALPPTAEDTVFERLRQILVRALTERSLLSGCDFIALIRHVLRRQSLREGRPAMLLVPSDPFWPTREGWERYGVRAQSGSDGRRLLEARVWSPAWLPESDRPVFEDAFAERNVRLDWRRPIDPFLKDASGFETYVSPGQREAVRSAILLPPGESLIVALPTGSGKSFVAQAPVLIGGLEGGLSLCVVPTTALAIDQARQTSELLKARYPGRDLPPLAWHAALTPDERAAIKSAIREGRQRLLYCSPEAVCGALLPSLYDCAKAGLLAYLIVDEAHLVSQWGDAFRPAFQLLAGVRRGLMEACAGSPFKTLLMSATLTSESIATLEALFGPAATVRMVASLHLRPEPQYWIHREDNADQKERKILEALRHAPRPFILYVTERRDARRWLQVLRTEGYARLECFHGETSAGERGRIIDAWSKNQVDGIVATSAFGVGIDKRDVRTVIHAAVPETVDRFYQEVGRGGRDGCSSASMMIYSSEDRDAARQIASPSLISDDLGFGRWNAMYDRRDKAAQIGRRLRLDLTVVPPHLRQQSDYNSAWNMRTLIMMARAGMLELVSEAPERIIELEGETDAEFELRNEEHWGKYFQHVIVNVQEGAHRDRPTFDRQIQKERDGALRAASMGLAVLDDLLEGQREVASLLDELYREHAPGRSIIVSPACGGCPAHRRLGESLTDYAEPPAQGIERVAPTDLTIWRDRFPHLDPRAPVILSIPDEVGDHEVAGVLKDLVALFGVREIAVSGRFRQTQPDLATLHRSSPDGVLLLQDLAEDLRLPSLYQIARATVCGPDPRELAKLLTLDRPLHVLLVRTSTADPVAHRPFTDTALNLLTLEHFRIGARR